MSHRHVLINVLRLSVPTLLSLLAARLLATAFYYFPRHAVGWINLAIVLTSGTFFGCLFPLIGEWAIGRLRHSRFGQQQTKRGTETKQQKPEFFVAVVDDEPSLADALVRILELNDLKAVALYSGEAAVQLAKQSRPYAYVMGVYMSGMDGITAACEILKFYPLCQFLFVSGHAENAKPQIEALADKGYAFKLLEKPGPPATIVAWVQAWKLVYDAVPFPPEPKHASAAGSGVTN